MYVCWLCLGVGGCVCVCENVWEMMMMCEAISRSKLSHVDRHSVDLNLFVRLSVCVRLCVNVDVRRCVFTGFFIVQIHLWLCWRWRWWWWWCLVMVAFNHMFAISISLICMCRETLHRFHSAKQFSLFSFFCLRGKMYVCVLCLFVVYLVGWFAIHVVFLQFFFSIYFLIFLSTFPFLRCVKVWECVCVCIYVCFSLFSLNFYAFSMQF